ncbi:UNVERIFIED_ORG: adenosylmethionine-8-amino-7-oxononanoate aminotransferase [Variovorax paradoxus]|nr:adenosylmethionine-8-amino-7-oxononanoate aminotransferase [Variovorax paradoxus]
MERDDLVSEAARKGERLMARLREALGSHSNVGDLRGLGLIAAIELVEDRATKQAFDPARKIGAAVLAEAKQRGLVTRGRGDQIYVGPALVMEDAMIDRLVDLLAESVETVLSKS